MKHLTSNRSKVKGHSGLTSHCTKTQPRSHFPFICRRQEKVFFSRTKAKANVSNHLVVHQNFFLAKEKDRRKRVFAKKEEKVVLAAIKFQCRESLRVGWKCRKATLSKMLWIVGFCGVGPLSAVSHLRTFHQVTP